jgi:hypothetical protein
MHAGDLNGQVVAQTHSALGSRLRSQHQRPCRHVWQPVLSRPALFGLRDRLIVTLLSLATLLTGISLMEGFFKNHYTAGRSRRNLPGSEPDIT